MNLSDLPCPRLVRSLAAGLLRYVGEEGSQITRASFSPLTRQVAGFVRFVAAAEQDDDLGPEGLNADHVEAFEAALIARYPRSSSQPNAVLAGVIRVLRHAQEASPASFGPELAARVAYGPRLAARRVRPLDAYPPKVFEAIHTAALEDVRAIRQRISDGEALAAAGQDPDIGGWDKIENVLWYVANRRPMTLADIGAQRWPVGHLLGGMRSCNHRLYLARRDVLPFLVLLICLTGLEPEAAKRLKADCLVNPARGFVSIRYVKLRSRGHEARQLRVSDGGTLGQPGGVVRLVLRLTELARARTGSDALWLSHGWAGTCDAFGKDNMTSWLGYYAGEWMKGHGLDQLTDSDGQPVRLDMRRLRKSYKSRQYLRAAGILADFTQGHSRQVAAGHYADIGVHQEIHELAVEAGLREALEVALPAPVVIDDSGQRLDAGEDLPDEQVQAARSGASDVFLASCRDFYDSPYGIRGKPCPVALWGCLECPNAVFMARHLPPVLTFLDFIERQRDELPAAEWNVRFGLAWERIVHGIRDRFRVDQIATAQAIAEGGGARLLLPPEFGEGLS